MAAHISPKQISAWLDGQLKPKASARIERHLDQCPVCRSARDELVEVDKAFRRTAVLEPPEHLWAEISSHLSRTDQSPASWLSRFGFVDGRPGWLRPELCALAATILLGCSLAIMHWSSTYSERRQLAQIDRAYQALLPPNAESYNPFAASPLNDTARNPFTLPDRHSGAGPSNKPGAKR